MIEDQKSSEVKEGGALENAVEALTGAARAFRDRDAFVAQGPAFILALGRRVADHIDTVLDALAARPPSMERGEAEGWRILQSLRRAGWMVAVHNDYALAGVPMTFWLFTNRDGRWIKGEGTSDLAALEVAAAMLAAAPSPAPSAVDNEVAPGQLDRLFFGGGEYVRADKAVAQIMELQRRLAAPSAVEMAGVEEKAARLIYAAFEEHDQDDWPWPSFDTNKQYYDAGKGANGYYWTAIRLAPAILALATASREKGAVS